MNTNTEVEVLPECSLARMDRSSLISRVFCLMQRGAMRAPHIMLYMKLMRERTPIISDIGESKGLQVGTRSCSFSYFLYCYTKESFRAMDKGSHKTILWGTRNSITATHYLMRLLLCTQCFLLLTLMMGLIGDQALWHRLHIDSDALPRPLTRPD